ncbi:MAG: diguanylate cyclase [Phyllobacterium sp.]
MRGIGTEFSLPKWRITRWLSDAGPDVPRDIRAALITSLFGTLPIFLGGVINTILVAAVIAFRLPQAAFWAWLACEIAICLARGLVLYVSHRNAQAGRETPTDIYILLAVAWSATVGYGCLISMLSGDWVAATLACLSAGAMVGGICFRNFGAPRLACVMIILSLGPTCFGAAVSGEPILYVILLQIPFYLISMAMASYRLNLMLVATMLAERENERRASQDGLTGLMNRSGLLTEIGARCADPEPNRHIFSVLYLDLDGFKLVNDRYGHARGDHVLSRISERIQARLGPNDAAARIGGDEFVIIRNQADRDAAIEFATSLTADLSAPMALSDGSSVNVGCSVGIAFAPAHGKDAVSLLEAADAALYKAKTSEKQRHEIAL